MEWDNATGAPLLRPALRVGRGDASSTVSFTLYLLLFLALLQVAIRLFITLWKVGAAFVRPCANTLNSYNPSCVMNAVFSL